LRKKTTKKTPLFSKISIDFLKAMKKPPSKIPINLNRHLPYNDKYTDMCNTSKMFLKNLIKILKINEKTLKYYNCTPSLPHRPYTYK
jgi:hypothetical protein